MEKVFTKEVEEKYKKMQDAFEKIDLEKITVLTGSNGSGKSLIRKQTPFLMVEKLCLKSYKDTKGMIKSTSMDARTSNRPEFGALSSIMNDTEWIATSQNTLHSISGLFNAILKDKKNETLYLIIDEFEIGCAEETVLALAYYINENVEKIKNNTNVKGVLIITHSRLAVEKLKYDEFINIDGLTKDEWLNREIIPIDLKNLEENELFFYIRDYNKKTT